MESKYKEIQENLGKDPNYLVKKNCEDYLQTNFSHFFAKNQAKLSRFLEEIVKTFSEKFHDDSDWFLLGGTYGDSELKKMVDKGIRLTAEQRECVNFPLSHQVLIVNAGPGTGKTEIIKERMRFIVEQNLNQQQLALVLTFNKNISVEIWRKLKLIISKNVTLLQKNNQFLKRSNFSPHQVMNRTFHSLCYLIFNEEQEKISEVRSVLEKSGRLDLYEPIKEFFISDQRKRFWLFFDDVVENVTNFLKKDEEKKKRWQVFNHILVDESQDLNEEQLRMIKQLCLPHTTLTFV
ncbi:14482_t:CDS:2, partial [Racocetra persica]